MNIVFPELTNPIIKSAIETYNSTSSQPITPLPAPDLASACQMVTSGQADSMIAGIDYSSRDVILACREYFGTARKPQLLKPLQVQSSSTSDDFAENSTYSTFSGLAVMQRTIENSTETLLLADMAACKHPTKDQLREIILQTYTTAQKILPNEPRLALLSFSTLGSGGRDDFITIAQELVSELTALEILIDGELQLDAAINPRVGQKKAPGSPVAGHANVLIAPDLNTGNILYKSLEHFGGFTVAGPILQGFTYPVSDLSRGSTVEDVILTIDTMVKITQ